LVILLVNRKTLKRVVRKRIIVAAKAVAKAVARAARRHRRVSAVDEVRSPKWAASNFNFYKV
jgi:hypothetical protein